MKKLARTTIEYLRIRWLLIKANTLYTFLNETAYMGDNWISILSTLFYNFAYIGFIKVIYANTNTVAGYTFDQMMIFYFVFENGAYLNYAFGWANIRQLIIDINKGDLDLVLIRPVPSLFFASLKKLRIFTALRDGIPPLVIVALFINWGSFDFKIENVIACIIIFLFGFISIYAVLCMSAIPTFWFGEGDAVMGLVNEAQADAGGTLPFEGYSKTLQIIFTVAFPALILGGISTSVLLGKSEPVPMIILSIVVALVFLRIRTILWNFALKHYTSASS